MRLFCYVTSLMMLFLGVAQAQDRRPVAEPRIPRSCVVLQARLAAVDGVLPGDSEKNRSPCAAVKILRLEPNHFSARRSGRICSTAITQILRSAS